VSTPIYEQEVILGNGTAGLALIRLLFLGIEHLERAEYDNVEALVNMRSVRRITKDMDPMLTRKEQEGESVVGVMAVDQ
jgi:hypothetical protein